MKKLSLLFAITILSVNLASAFTFINIYVDETGSSQFLGETDKTTLNLPEDISLNSKGEISGKTNALTSKTGELWTFSYTLENSELNVILPEGAVIKTLSPGVEIALEGERISLFASGSIEVSYEVIPVQKPLIPSGNIPIIIGLIAVLIILTVFIINYSKREEKEKKTKTQNIEHLLNDREKLILAKLKETGKIKSSQLRKNVQMPKASFSRHIQELEKKKLIKRSGEGKNKFVELIE